MYRNIVVLNIVFNMAVRHANVQRVIYVLSVFVDRFNCIDFHTYLYVYISIFIQCTFTSCVRVIYAYASCRCR